MMRLRCDSLDIPPQRFNDCLPVLGRWSCSMPISEQLQSLWSDSPLSISAIGGSVVGVQLAAGDQIGDR